MLQSIMIIILGHDDGKAGPQQGGHCQCGNHKRQFASKSLLWPAALFCPPCYEDDHDHHHQRILQIIMIIMMIMMMEKQGPNRVVSVGTINVSSPVNL